MYNLILLIINVNLHILRCLNRKIYISIKLNIGFVTLCANKVINLWETHVLKPIRFMQKIIVLTLFLVFSINLSAQEKKAYKMFNANGSKTSYKKLLKKAQNADIILFGEYHDNPIIHWLQYELTVDLAKDGKLTLGAEMVKTEDQQHLDKYLKGEMKFRTLDSIFTRWNNFITDYKPLVDIAKKNDFEFIATNVPRRISRQVFKGGFKVLDTMSDADKQWFSPLPIDYDETLPGYVKMKTMLGKHAMVNLPKAQALKDATMAFNILKNKKKDQIFVHYNGCYHSDNYEGIYWYLKKLNSDIKILTISTSEQPTIDALDDDVIGKADIIIAVPESMTKTHFGYKI